MWGLLRVSSLKNRHFRTLPSLILALRLFGLQWLLPAPRFASVLMWAWWLSICWDTWPAIAIIVSSDAPLSQRLVIEACRRPAKQHLTPAHAVLKAGIGRAKSHCLFLLYRNTKISGNAGPVFASYQVLQFSRIIRSSELIGIALRD